MILMMNLEILHKVAFLRYPGKITQLLIVIYIHQLQLFSYTKPLMLFDNIYVQSLKTCICVAT